MRSSKLNLVCRSCQFCPDIRICMWHICTSINVNSRHCLPCTVTIDWAGGFLKQIECPAHHSNRIELLQLCDGLVYLISRWTYCTSSSSKCLIRKLRHQMDVLCARQFVFDHGLLNLILQFYLRVHLPSILVDVCCEAKFASINILYNRLDRMRSKSSNTTLCAFGLV